MLLSARAIAQAALLRAESRGAHHRSDFPAPAGELEGMHLVHHAMRGGWRLTTFREVIESVEPTEAGR